LAVLLPVIALTVVALTTWGLDGLAIGDETAHVLGISPTRFRTQLLVVVLLCIGFVGLVGSAHAWAVPTRAPGRHVPALG
jgi:iron complex transport system permease protein